jgi:hypothetical protein
VIWPPIGEILRYLVALSLFPSGRGGLLAERQKVRKRAVSSLTRKVASVSVWLAACHLQMFLKAEYELAGLPNMRSA